jgi:hypothetical protein
MSSFISLSDTSQDYVAGGVPSPPSWSGGGVAFASPPLTLPPWHQSASYAALQHILTPAT